MSLIVFGSGMLGKNSEKLKENRSDVTSAFYRSFIKKRDNWQLQLMYTKHQKLAMSNDPLTSMSWFATPTRYYGNEVSMLTRTYRPFLFLFGMEREPIFQAQKKVKCFSF